MNLGDYIQALSAFDEAITEQDYLGSAYYHKALLMTAWGFHDHNSNYLNTALEDVNKAIKFSVDNTRAQGLKGLLTQILRSP